MMTARKALLAVLFAGAFALSAESFRFEIRKPADVEISGDDKDAFQSELATCFDEELKRDVLKITYAMKPGRKDAAKLGILIPELAQMRWEKVEKIVVVMRGGLGHLNCGISDFDKEWFFAKGFRSLPSQWKEITFDYSNPTPENCHIWGGNQVKFRNKRPDAPVRATGMSILVRPGHLAAQLRKAAFDFSLKPTEEEIAHGMEPVECCLASVIVYGTPYRPGESAAEKKPFRFREIGTIAPLKSGNQEKLSCVFRNGSGKTETLQISGVSRRMLTDHVENCSQELTLKPNETRTLELPFSFAENGFYDVRLKVTSGDTVTEEKTFVNVWTPAGNTGETQRPLFWGTQASLDLFNSAFGPHREQDYKNMRDAGFTLLRSTLRWSAIQPEKDGECKWAPYDRIVEKCLEYGLTPYLMVANAPRWSAADPETAKTAPKFVFACRPDNDLYADFIRKAALRYGDKVVFQIWNEPYANQYYWGGTPATYADMVKKAYAAVKQVNPKIIVNTGGCWDEVMAETPGSFDFWPFHHHSPASEYHAMISRMRELLAKNGKTDMGLLWADECGLAVNPKKENSEIEKASEVIKKSIISRATGLSNHVCFVYRGSVNAPTADRDNYPFIDENHRCRPPVIAHSNMVNHLRNSVLAKDFCRPGEADAYLFDTPKGKVFVFWRGGIAKGQVISVLFTKPVQGTITNLLGSSAPFETKGRLFTQSMTPEPVYLTLPADTQIESVRYDSLLTIPQQVVLKAGENRKTVDVSVANPFPEPLNAVFTVKGESGWQAEPARREISIPSEEKKEFPFVFQSDREQTGIAYADFYFSAPAVKMELHNAVRFVMCAPLTAKERQYADIDAAGNMINLRTGDVDADMFWQGKEDLSAKIYSWWDPKNLNLRILVCDNIHYQVQPEKGLFEGDSVQLAFRTPEYSQIGLALLNDGTKTFAQWKGAPMKKVDFDIVRKGNQTEYTIHIPWSDLGIVPEKGTTFEMSALVNDNDSRCRKVLLEWGGGIHGMRSGSPMNPFILE